MNKCLDADQIIVLEEGLRPDPREAIRHLASCDVCRRSLDDVVELRSLLNHAAGVDPSVVEQVVEGVQVESQHEAARHRHLIGLLEIAFGTAVATVVLALVGGATWTDVGPAPITWTGMLVTIAWAIATFVHERPIHGGVLP